MLSVSFFFVCLHYKVKRLIQVTVRKREIMFRYKDWDWECIRMGRHFGDWLLSPSLVSKTLWCLSKSNCLFLSRNKLSQSICLFLRVVDLLINEISSYPSVQTLRKIVWSVFLIAITVSEWSSSMQATLGSPEIRWHILTDTHLKHLRENVQPVELLSWMHSVKPWGTNWNKFPQKIPLRCFQFSEEWSSFYLPCGNYLWTSPTTCNHVFQL